MLGVISSPSTSPLSRRGILRENFLFSVGAGGNFFAPLLIAPCVFLWRVVYSTREFIFCPILP